MPIEFKIFFIAFFFIIGIAINLIVLGYFDEFLVIFQKYLFEIPERYEPVFFAFIVFTANAVFLRFVFDKTCRQKIEDECFKKELEFQKKIDNLELELKLLRVYMGKKENKA